MLQDKNCVARLCRKSSLDQETKAPTPASFEFRLDNQGDWLDAYLSVDGLEILPGSVGTIPERLAVLRSYHRENPLKVNMIRPSSTMAYAVLTVGAIRAADLQTVGTTLDCHQHPRANGDPHCGVQPSPGVDHWINGADDPAHLAVTQYLWLNVCHHEQAMPVQRG